ncbi:MAG: glycoside hydrolase 43 family protein [Bacteroidales bacterium]|nr:glycoside hydrolase 43 family protein [Bacteroidales bacterium]
MKKIYRLFPIGLIICLNLHAQPWVPELGNGTYKNPVIFADYSDPDIIRVGEDFYMVSSSFNCMPGIPVLHSKDLVNWKIINHVYDRLPFEKYNKPVHGEGSWAPAIRHFNQKFYVYFCTPHEGLFMAEADDPAGKWNLHHIENVALWEDPCPIWDEDGNAYLVRSKLCGNELFLHKMSPDGKKILDNGVSLYKDISQPTIEGPKFYKMNGYYYIFAPAGGVPKGWQTILRSKNIYGPYESRVVLHQGNTEINGPHQGGLVELPSGEWWFMHFQDRDLYGRIVHLQPVSWKDGWPLIGVDNNNDGIGEPVDSYKKPAVSASPGILVPQTSDEFENSTLGLQWQWHANPKGNWYSITENQGNLRLYAVKNFTQNGNLWFVPNLLLQKFPAPSFTVTTKINFTEMQDNNRSGLVIMGKEWAFLALTKTGDEIKIGMYEGSYVRCEDDTREIESIPLDVNTCYLRVFVNQYGICHFSYSTDNIKYNLIGKEFRAQKGVWIGAKVGLFCINPNITESEGYTEFEWFRVE